MLAIAQPITARAATDSPSPDFADPPAQDPLPTAQQKEFSEATDIAPQPPARPVEARRLGYFHKYRQGLSILGLGVADSKQLQDPGGALFRTSLLYLFSDDALRGYEAGAELLSDGTGAISLSRRFIFERTRFRPYTKAGFAIRIDPKDQLATFLRYEHYRLIGAAGFELNLNDPISLRFECGLGASFRSLEANAGAGLAWGF